MFYSLTGAKMTKVRRVKGFYCSKRHVRVGNEPGEQKVPQTSICFNHTKLLELTEPESPSSKPFLNCLQTRVRILNAQIYGASNSPSLNIVISHEPLTEVRSGGLRASMAAGSS